MESFLMSRNEKDRRRYPRVPCNLPVKMRRMDENSATTTKEKHREFSSTVVNLGQGGLRILANEPMGSNELYRLSIMLPESNKSVTAFGEVVWVDEHSGGVHFLAIHEEHENHLKDYVLSVCSS
jgi:hypothetical protein